VLGKHSGRHALRERVRELGFTLEDAEFERVFTEFKALADKNVPAASQLYTAVLSDAEHAGLTTQTPAESLDEAAEGGFEIQVEEEPLPAARFIKTAGRPVE
jgi:isopropylmalate/homocitrate/citramalate synthase